MGRMFETRKATMFARWDKMAKAFTRCGRDINTAVKSGGPDPDSNPSLRRAIQNARAVNMPKDKIDSAIKRAMGNDAADYAEVIYEGYAPNGIALLVQTATDNTTRTVANVRMHFNKCGGNLGNSGSVSMLFTRMAVFTIKAEGQDRDELELELIDAGLEDLFDDTTEDGEATYIIRAGFTDFGNMQKAIEERGIEPIKSQLEFIPTSTVELPEDKLDAVLKLIDKLEQDEDVQHVFTTLA